MDAIVKKLLTKEGIVEMTAEQCIIENEKLAYFVIRHKFNFSNPDIYDYHSLQDINQAALLGLYKSFKYYNIDKNIFFATYASMVIWNEIKMHLRKKSNQTMFTKCLSLNENITSSKKSENMDNLILQDVITDSLNIEEESILKTCINETVKTFNKNQKKSFELYVKGYTQDQATKEMKFSQSYISRINKSYKLKFYNAIYGYNIKINDKF